MTKRCGRCRKTKPINQFCLRKNSNDGHQPWCKSCSNTYTVDWQRRNPVRHQKNRRRCLSKLRNSLVSKMREIRRRQPTSKLKVDDLLILWAQQEGRCALTGEPMTWQTGHGRLPTNGSVDRIDNTKGYSRDNIQLVLDWANTAKSILTEEQFVRYCRLVVQKADEE